MISINGKDSKIVHTAEFTNISKNHIIKTKIIGLFQIGSAHFIFKRKIHAKNGLIFYG